MRGLDRNPRSAEPVAGPEQNWPSSIDKRTPLSIVYESYLTQLTSDMPPIVPSEVEKEIASSSEAPTSYPAGTFRPRVAGLPSLPEAHRTVAFSSGASWFRKMLAFAGPGYLVAVGYMDPGNWATDIRGAQKFAYSLLSLLVITLLMPMFLQPLSPNLRI